MSDPTTPTPPAGGSESAAQSELTSRLDRLSQHVEEAAMAVSDALKVFDAAAQEIAAIVKDLHAQRVQSRSATPPPPPPPPA